jgi:hypothetical protein
MDSTTADFFTAYTPSARSSCTAEVDVQPKLFDPDSGRPLLPNPVPEVGTNGHPSFPIDAAFRRLWDVEALGTDWDSYGSEATKHVAVATAHRLIWQVYMWSLSARRSPSTPYSVLPLSDGGVQVEWRGPAGAIEVEISSEGVLGYLLARGSGPTREFQERDGVPECQILELVRSVV